MTSGTWPFGWATGDVTLASEFKKGWGAIADTTLGGSAANVDMTSIVGTYAHLLVVAYARSDAATNSVLTNLQFNGDTAANYDTQRLIGSAATVVASESFAATSMTFGSIAANTAGANLFGASITFIPHYAGSANNKAAVSIAAQKNGTASGNMSSNVFAGFWRSNAAITRITLLPASGNFVAGTRVTLYALGA